MDLYGKPCKRDWMAKVVYLIQMLPTFGGRCNRYFWDIRLKILRLPNFNMLFQLVLTKFFKSELVSCLPKVGYVIKSCKEPIQLTEPSHSFITFFKSGTRTDPFYLRKLRQNQSRNYERNLTSCLQHLRLYFFTLFLCKPHYKASSLFQIRWPLKQVQRVMVLHS